MLDGVALVLGALSDDHRAILQRYGHAVVCGPGVNGIDWLGVLFANVFGLIILCHAITIGK